MSDTVNRSPPRWPSPAVVPRAARSGQADTKTETETKSQTRLSRPWNVIVWDDPVNLMSYVVYVFQKLFGFSAEVANTKMLEVHNDGRSVVASEERERAEYYVTRLHAYGLQATMEQDD